MSVTRLVCAGMFLGLFAPAVRAQPMASDRLEATMFIAGTGGRAETARALPLIEERLHVTIDGQHATTTLLQVYQHNNSGQIEGRYRLRPGSGSRVEGFAYWNGESKIVGEVFERQTAHRVYNQVTSRRRDPGLLEEDGEGAFAFKIFPIESNEKKRVELRWTKWLERRAQTVKYRAPITRGDAEVVISLAGRVKNLRSSTHRLHVEQTAGGVRLRSDGMRSPGELVLEWDVDEPDWQPSAFVHAGGKHDGWFALSLAAPNLPDDKIAAKDVTIVIDRSGSMNGDKMEQARTAAADMIKRLDSRDRINVIAFSDEVDPLFAAPQKLDPETRARAIAFAERLVDGGGTDIALALTTAIKSQDRKQQRPRVIVFMTDGQSDVDKAIAAAQTDTGDVRLFTLGLGKDVNRPLLSRLAALKRGRFTFIPDMSAIRTEVGRLAATISKPLLVGVTVEVEGAHAVRLYPRSLPDLFAEDELVVTGRLRGTGTTKFTVKGMLAGNPVAFTRTVDVARAPARPWVGRLWAQSRVEHLLEELSLGAKEPELTEEVLELALAYNFVTPYTAFLAIPESELGDMRGTVEAARERKAKVLAENPDVAALDHKRRSFRGGGNSSDEDAEDEPLAKSSKHDRDDAEVADVQGAPPEYANAPIQTTGSVSDRRRGCASCATGGSQPTVLFALAIVVLLIRRRRR